MKGFERSPASLGANPAFDELRALVELDVARPGIIALTSATNNDGKEVAARALCHLLSSSGYRTLFIEASLNNANAAKPWSADLREIARQLSALEMEAIVPVVLSLSDRSFQQSTSQRTIQESLNILRTKFDYTVIAADGSQSSFSMSLITSADAVLVSVRNGRRETADDTRLALSLKRVAGRFLGLVSIAPSMIVPENETTWSAIFAGARSGNKSHVEGKINV